MEAKLNCEEVLAGLPLHAGGDLESPDPAAVDRHLAGCDECRAAMERACAARAAFLGLAAAAGEPVEIWKGVRAGLVADGRIAAGPRPSAAGTLRAEPVRARRARWIPAAAAVLLAGCGLWLARDLLRTERGVAPGAAEQRLVEEFRETDAVAGAPELAAQPESADPGRRAVALRPMSPEDWPAAAPLELQPRALPDAGPQGNVMAGGAPSRIR